MPSPIEKDGDTPDADAMPSPPQREHDVAPNARNRLGELNSEFEDIVERERAKGELLSRVGTYLPSQRVERIQPRISKVGWLGASLKLVSGHFLALADSGAQTGPDTGIKQSVFEENVNMAVISALLLTLVVPMAFENTDDTLQEEFLGSGLAIEESALGEALGEESLGELLTTIGEVQHISFFVSLAGFLFATLASVYILLTVNEIGTDHGTQAFLRSMGKAMRLPYIFFSVGQVWAVGVIIRLVTTIKSWPGLVIELGILGISATVFCLFSQVYCVKCCNNVLHDRLCFEPLCLTDDEAKRDVEKYFAQALTSACLEDCLFDLQARSDVGSIIPLSHVSELLVKVMYHRKLAELMQVELDDGRIYALARQDRFGDEDDAVPEAVAGAVQDPAAQRARPDESSDDPATNFLSFPSCSSSLGRRAQWV